jgi:Mce-associated membrane protein
VTRQRPIAGQRNRRTSVLERPVPAEPVWDEKDRPAREATHRDPVLLVAGLVVVILLVTAGLLTVRARGADRVEQARTEATAAAEATAVDLLSYDYRHLDRDFARARAGLTGGFVDDYAKTTQTVVRPTATEVMAVVKADVAASSVVRADQNRVVVLLFVNQTTTSTRLDAPKVDLNRVRLTMDRVDGRWLVSKVVAL